MSVGLVRAALASGPFLVVVWIFSPEISWCSSGRQTCTWCTLPLSRFTLWIDAASADAFSSEAIAVPDERCSLARADRSEPTSAASVRCWARDELASVRSALS